MIDEDLFQEWFDKQSYWRLYCDSDNGQYYCGMRRCIDDYKENHIFEVETISLIRKILEGTDNTSDDDIAVELFNALKEDGAFE